MEQVNSDAPAESTRSVERVETGLSGQEERAEDQGQGVSLQLGSWEADGLSARVWESAPTEQKS